MAGTAAVNAKTVGATTFNKMQVALTLDSSFFRSTRIIKLHCTERNSPVACTHVQPIPNGRSPEPLTRNYRRSCPPSPFFCRIRVLQRSPTRSQNTELLNLVFLSTAPGRLGKSVRNTPLGFGLVRTGSLSYVRPVPGPESLNMTSRLGAP